MKQKNDQIDLLQNLVRVACETMLIPVVPVQSVIQEKSVRCGIPQELHDFWASRKSVELAKIYNVRPLKIERWAKLFNLSFLSTLPDTLEFVEFARTHTLAEISEHLGIVKNKVRELLNRKSIAFLGQKKLPNHITDEIRSFLKSKTKSQIISHYGVGIHYFISWSRKNGIDYLDRELDEPYFVLYPELTDDFRKFCADHDLKEIIEYTGFKGTSPTLRRYLQENHVEFAKHKAGKMPKAHQINDELRAFFLQHSHGELAKFYDVNLVIISTFCRKYGIKTKRRGKEKVADFFKTTITDELRSHFAAKTKEELAKEYGICFTYILKFCQQNNIKTFKQRKQTVHLKKRKVAKIEMTKDVIDFCNSHTREEIAKHFNFSLASVQSLLANFPELTPIKSNKYERSLPCFTEDQREFYEKHTRRELTKILNADYSSVCEWVRRNKINAKRGSKFEER